MSPFIEVEGKNIEKAIEKACSKLKVARDALKYEVISYGSSGIFGLAGIKKARIRVATTESGSRPNSEPIASEQYSDGDVKKDVPSLIQETFDGTESCRNSYFLYSRMSPTTKFILGTFSM